MVKQVLFPISTPFLSIFVTYNNLSLLSVNSIKKELSSLCIGAIGALPGLKNNQYKLIEYNSLNLIILIEVSLIVDSELNPYPDLDFDQKVKQSPVINPLNN